MIDLKLGENQYRFKYPQEVPHIIPIMDPLEQVTEMSILVLQRLDKKYKKVGKGEIKILPKQLMNEKFSFQTLVYLELLEKKISERNPTTDILKAYGNKGQIYLKVQLFDIVLDDLPKLAGKPGGKGPAKKGAKDGKAPSKPAAKKSAQDAIVTMLKDNVELVSITKEGVQNVKSEKYKDFTSKENNLLRDIKKGNIHENDDLYEDIIEEEVIKEEFPDQCSNVSVSVIDGIDENRMEIENMNIGIDIILDMVRDKTYRRLDEFIPQDPEEMKLFIEEYANKVGVISQSYFRNLKTLSEINNGLKFQAKDFYEKYKELKKNFTLERRDLKEKLIDLDKQTASNIEENNRLHSNLDDLRAEVQFFANEIGVEDDAIYREEDFQVMLSIINDVANAGNNVFEGLDKDEQADLQRILRRYRYDLAIVHEAIPHRLEVLINDLYLNKKIINSVSVSETDHPDIYKFDNMIVTLYVEDNMLKVKEKGYRNFEEWIVTNFPKLRTFSNLGIKNSAKKSLTGSAVKPGAGPKKSITSGVKPKSKPK